MIERVMIYCRECKRNTLHREGESYCEDCGSHSAWVCNICANDIDRAYNGNVQTFSGYRQQPTAKTRRYGKQVMDE